MIISGMAWCIRLVPSAVCGSTLDLLERNRVEEGHRVHVKALYVSVVKQSVIMVTVTVG